MVVGDVLPGRVAGPGSARSETVSFSRRADPSGPFISAQWLTDEQLSDPLRVRAAHPDLPRGLFDLLWRHLASEQVACYYSRRPNHEAWAFNVIVRCGATLLVVAMSPRSVGHLAHAGDLCDSALAAERRQTLAGADGRAAEAGRVYLTERLTAAGHDSPAAWLATCLAAEGTLLAEHPTDLPRPSRPVGPLSALLLAVHNLRSDCDALLQALPQHSVFTGQLRRAEEDTVVTRTILPAIADAAASVAGPEHDHGRVVLANTGNALQKLARRIDLPLKTAGTLSARTRRQMDRVRMAIVAAHVVGEAVGALAVDRIVNFTTDLGPDLVDLCRALEQSVSDMAIEAANLAEDLTALAQACEEADREVAEFRRWVSRYRLQVAQLPDAERLSDLTCALDQHLAASEDSPFGQVGQACHTLPVCFDFEKLVQHLHEVRAAAAGTTDSHQLPRGG